MLSHAKDDGGVYAFNKSTFVLWKSCFICVHSGYLTGSWKLTFLQVQISLGCYCRQANSLERIDQPGEFMKAHIGQAIALASDQLFSLSSLRYSPATSETSKRKMLPFRLNILSLLFLNVKWSLSSTGAQREVLPFTEASKCSMSFFRYCVGQVDWALISGPSKSRLLTISPWKLRSHGPTQGQSNVLFLCRTKAQSESFQGTLDPTYVGWSHWHS